MDESRALMSMAKQTTTRAIQRRDSVVPDEEVENRVMEEVLRYRVEAHFSTDRYDRGSDIIMIA
jgi:hypothetical protein